MRTACVEYLLELDDNSIRVFDPVEPFVALNTAPGKEWVSGFDA